MEGQHSCNLGYNKYINGSNGKISVYFIRFKLKKLKENQQVLMEFIEMGHNFKVFVF